MLLIAVLIGVAQLLPNPDALPPPPNPRMALTMPSQATTLEPTPVTKNSPPPWQFYWINKWRYARHVGLRACWADNGEYVGEVARVDYVVSGDSRHWVYSFIPRPTQIQTEPPTNRELARVVRSKPVVLRGAAADFLVTRGSCPDGQPTAK